MKNKKHKWVAWFVIACLFVTGSFFMGAAFYYYSDPTGTDLEQSKRELVREESAVVNVVENVSDSVVTIAITTPQRRVLQFNPFGGFSPQVEEENQQDIGSGFVVDADGLIVTNKHVVDNPDAEYTVILNDGSEHQVLQTTTDPSNDLAIIKIDKNDLVPIKFADTDNLRVGQFVIAIGTALGEFRQTVTTGVISGLGRGITAGSANPFEGFVERLDDVIQTDAAINLGNSGGPLLNSLGELIGVNTAISAEGQNIGFAIPANLVSAALDQFKTNGQFASRPFLGVQYQMISRQAALLNEVPEGALVMEVVPNSSADASDIREGDIIVQIDDQELQNENDLGEIISTHNPGDQVTIRLWRDGEFIETQVTLNAPDQGLEAS